jgi:nucleoside-diphosphate-sugar epimerase
MMQLLISGSSGFVGSNFKSYLAPFNGYNIRDLVRQKTSNSSQDISWELTNGLPEEIYAVLHFAGKAHDLKNTSDASVYFEVNTKLSIHLFKAFLNSNAHKFIFISSVKAVADKVDGILTEETICDPLTAYGQSKYQAELAMQKLLAKYNANIASPKILYILRPCMIHGPGNKGNLNLLYQLIKKGIPYPLGAFENKRSFLSIENLCFVLKKLLDKNYEGGTYQIADDDALSTNQLIEIIAEADHRQSKIWHIPEVFIESMAKIGDALHLPFNTELLQKLTESYVVDNAKIKQLLNSELPIKARDGLLRTIRSFNSN